MHTGKTHILVIEPSEINRNLVHEILQERAYSVTEAADCWEGLRALDHQPFDLILLDKHLCNTDATLMHTKILKLGPDLPIIIFCTDLSQPELRNFIQQGVFSFIIKPYSRAHLLAHVEEALNFRYRDRRPPGSTAS